MTPQEIANTPGLGSGGFDIMGSSLEGFDFSKIDPSFFQGLGDYVNSKKTPAEKIYEQIKGQSNNLGTVKSFETGAAGSREGGFGSTDAVMKDMARILADAGLTSIEQFGRGPLKDPVSVRPELAYSGWLGGSTKPKNPNNTVIPEYDGENNITGYSEYSPTGRWYTTQHSYDGEGSYSGSTNTFLSPQEIASYGLTGKSQPQTVMMNQGRTGFFNKETGEDLTAKFPGWGGQGWGGTAAGDGQTVYDVNFDPTTGLPIFYNRQTHGRDRYAGLLKAAAIGTAIFAPQIGAALLPAGSSAAAALAVGSAVSGLIGSGGNIEQGIKSGLAAYLGGQAGSWAGQASNSALVGNIASNMTRAAILGGDMSQALVSSLVQAAPAEIIKHFPNFSELPRAAQEAAVAATVDLMRSGGDNLGTIAIKGATDGLTDYTLKQIPGYDGLRKGQQDVVRERVSNVVRGESLTNEVLQGAIQFGAEAVRYQADTDRAIKAGWSSLEQQQSAQSLYGSKVTPDQFSDKQETTEEEAKQFARNILGREPTEFEYMQLVGLPERTAIESSDLKAVRYDEDTFDSNELAEAYKAVYGKEPTAEWLASDEAFDMLGRSDAQGKNILRNYYVQDKNTTTGTEAEDMWKAMGNTGPIPEDVLFNMLSMSQPGATRYAQDYTDRASVTFDGSGYETTEQARAAAIGSGYNSFTDPVTGKTQVIMPEDESLKRSNLIRQVLDAQGVNPATATPEQRQQAMTLVGGVAQDKLDSTNVVDLMVDAGIAGGSFVKRESNLNYILTAPPTSSAPKAFDGTKYGTQTNAAIAAASRGQDTFTWTDGKTYKVPTEIAKDGKSGALRDKAFAADLTSLADAFARGEISNTEYKFLEAGVKKQANVVTKLSENKNLRSAQEAAGQTVGWANLGTESKATISGLDKAIDYALTQGEGVGNLISNIGQTIGALTVDAKIEGNADSGFVDGVPKFWMDPDNNIVTNTGKNIADFFSSRYSDSAKTQRAAILAEVNRKGATEASVAAKMLENLHGAATFTGAEFAEELAPFLVGGGIGAAFKLGRAGLTALIGTTSTLGDLAEVYGPTYVKTRKESLARGDSEATANSLATRAASGNALITAVTEGPLNFMLAKSLLADSAKNAAFKVGGNIAAQMAGQYVEVMAHNINERFVLTGNAPTLADLNSYRGQATFETLIAGGTTSGLYVLAAANPSKIIGKDYEGNDFTVADAIAKPTEFDPRTLNVDASVIDPVTGKKSSLLNVLDDASTTYANGYNLAVTESVIAKNPSQSLRIMKDMGLADWTSSGEVTFSPDAGNIATAFISSNTVLPQSNGTYTPTFDFMTLPGVKDNAGIVNPSAAPPAVAPPVVAESVDPAFVGPRRSGESVGSAQGATEDPFGPLRTPTLEEIMSGSQPLTNTIPPVVESPAVAPPEPTSPVVTPPTGGEVVAVDPDEGTALVVDNNGNVSVVDNTNGALVPGDVVPVTQPAATPDVAPSEVPPTATPVEVTPAEVAPPEVTSPNAIQPTANITSQDVEKIVSDALKANPGLTAEDVQTIVSDAVATIPNLTADQVSTIVGAEIAKLPAAATPEDVSALATLIGTPGGKDAAGTGIIGQLEAMGATDVQIKNLVGNPATGTEPATGLYKTAEDAAVRGENAATAVQTALGKVIGAPSVKDDPSTPNVNEAVAATGLYGQMEASQAQMNEQYNALTAAQKVTADALVAQGQTLAAAIATAQEQTQTQITNLGTEVNNRITELMQQGQTYQQATQQAFTEVNAKNQELSGLIGTQGRTANQSDIDALADMLGGKRSMDLNYDVTGDKQITQADIDFLTQVVGGVKTDWTAPQQSPWAATGLYGQIQANELQRQKDLADAEAQRLADQQAAAEAARKAEIRSGIRATAAQGQQQLQNIQQQLPQALRMAQEVSTPIYGQMGPYLDVGSDLDFGFFKPSPEKQAGTKQQQPTKIAAGGYIDDLLAGDMTVDDLLNLLR
jgi:hypothetical protein